MKCEEEVITFKNVRLPSIIGYLANGCRFITTLRSETIIKCFNLLFMAFSKKGLSALEIQG